MIKHTDDHDNTISDKVELIEETASVETREVVTGKVRVTTSTKLIDETATRELQGTDTDTKRVPVNRMLDPEEIPPEPRTEGDTTCPSSGFLAPMAAQAKTEFGSSGWVDYAARCL